VLLLREEENKCAEALHQRSRVSDAGEGSQELGCVDVPNYGKSAYEHRQEDHNTADNVEKMGCRVEESVENCGPSALNLYISVGFQKSERGVANEYDKEEQ